MRKNKERRRGMRFREMWQERMMKVEEFVEVWMGNVHGMRNKERGTRV